MKRVVFAVVLVVLTAGAVWAAEDQAYLGIFAETSLMKMVGMPAMPELPAGMDPKMLERMPGMSKMMGMGKPQRKLTIRLWSPGLAPKDATAVIAPPKGLKQGDTLNLDLYRPKAGAETGGDLPDQANPDKIEGFTIKIYWGSSKTVKAGQPKVITWAGMGEAEKQRMREQRQKAMARDSYFYKPDWTTGYWPTKKQAGEIVGDASLVGNWALTTTYAGNVALDAPTNVDFLAPINITSPSLDDYPPLDKPLSFTWQAVPNALGLHANAFGMEGRNTMIIWTSSEVLTENYMALDWDYMQMADVLALVKSQVMMKGDRTSVDIPAGIFQNCDTVMFSMIGYGPGAALDKGQPLPRLQTKTMLSIAPLGGKMVQQGGRRGMFGM